MRTSGLTLTTFAALVFAACTGIPTLVPSDAEAVLGHRTITEPDPSAPGTHPVSSLYYGSGTDKRRAEFRDSVSITTEPVDASKLVDLGNSAKSRNKYWGFTPEEFPINGRVWFPDAEGSFPLILVVHGNHNMKEFSDPGYEYLGRFLASRGYVLASVDMNFINGGIRGENDGRGWLLLKHLQAWRGFTEDPDNPLYGKADIAQIALIGHSRGGEAVGHAAAFNRLDRYPDDGTLEFDFGFDIKSLIAIAPVDGQYLPTGRHVPVSNVNYLVFHGSHDGDVTSFHGLRQYQRVEFDQGTDYFKAAVYMYRANHGQWNTVWNNKDRGPRSGRSLRLDALVDPEDQRRFARVYLAAFLDATLKGDGRYLSLFRDHRTAGDWLPGTMYVTRYQHATFIPVATFEEDIDLTTGTHDAAFLSADSLDTWKEDALVLRSRNRTSTSNAQQNQAAWLAWERDSTNVRPAFRIRLAENLPLDGHSTLELLLSPDSGFEPDSLASVGIALDLTVELEDESGRSSGVPLSHYGPIRKPLDIQLLRRNLDDDRFGSTSEIVLQGFTLPLSDFMDQEPDLGLDRLREIRFVFDKTAAGSIILDDVGFASPGRDFLRYRLPEALEDR